MDLMVAVVWVLDLRGMISLVVTTTTTMVLAQHGPTAPLDLKSVKDWNGLVRWGRGLVDLGVGRGRVGIREGILLLILLSRPEELGLKGGRILLLLGYPYARSGMGEFGEGVMGLNSDIPT